MADSIDALFVQISNAVETVWDSASQGLPNLNSLPHQLHEALFAPGGVVDKLTNGGTVPLPVPQAWLDSVSNSTQTVQPPPPPPASSPLYPQWLRQSIEHILRHPYWYTLATISVTTSLTYYYSPRSLTPLLQLVPASLLPPPKHRPLRLLPNTHGVAAEVRKEAALVLGADTVEGREIALDLERKGWVVIATVTDPDQVDKLERQGRGWIKVLVLDPTESSSVGPFLRSLSTALSLRFPLHTSGDPFSRPSHALSLTSIVDASSLSHHAELESLVPIEALESDQVKRQVGERIVTFVGIVKGVLPILRSSSSRPHAPTGVYLLLLPSISSNVSLPFLSLSSTLSQSLSSMVHSLRREVDVSTPRPNVKLEIVQCGAFDHQSGTIDTTSPSPSSSSSSPVLSTTTTQKKTPPLPVRLDALYAPALRRRGGGGTTPHSTSTSTSSIHHHHRSPSPLRLLTRRINLLLTRPHHFHHPISLIGSSSKTYYYWFQSPSTMLCNNHWSVDGFLRGQDWIVRNVVMAKEKVGKVLKRRGQKTGGGRGGPLSNVPTTKLDGGEERGEGEGIPESLRPGRGVLGGGSNKSSPSSIPSKHLKDSFLPNSTSTPDSTTRLNEGSGGGGGYETDSGEEEESSSSIEDFGINSTTGSFTQSSSSQGGRGEGGGEGMESVYGTGSFVKV